MKKKKKKVMRTVNFSVSILTTILVIIVMIFIGYNAYEFGYRVYTEPAMSSQEAAIDKVVQVNETMSSMEIGKLLESKGLIDNSFLFFVQLKLSSYADGIKPGIYTLNTGMTAEEMMQELSAEEIEDTEES